MTPSSNVPPHIHSPSPAGSVLKSAACELLFINIKAQKETNATIVANEQFFRSKRCIQDLKNNKARLLNIEIHADKSDITTDGLFTQRES